MIYYLFTSFSVSVTTERKYLLFSPVNSQFVDFLVANTGAPFSSIHLMGHSLGAHVVGGAGAAVTLGRIPRITGNLAIY